MVELTPDGLPVFGKEALEKILGETEEAPSDIVDEEADLIRKENSLLYELMLLHVKKAEEVIPREFAEKDFSPEDLYITAFTQGFAESYRALRLQSRLNKGLKI